MIWVEKCALTLAHLGSRSFRRSVVRWPMARRLREVERKVASIGALSRSEIHRILVLRPNHRLGNLLLLTPLLAELQRIFPGAEIDILAAGTVAHAILGKFFSVGRIDEFSRFIVRHLPRTAAIVWAARQRHYDLAIDPSIDSHSNRLIVSWVAPRHVIGMPGADHRDWLHAMLSAPSHLAMLPVFLLRKAVIGERVADHSEYPLLDICLTAAERQEGRHAVERILRGRSRTGSEPVVGIFANATGAKRYPEKWWCDFLDNLTQDHPEYRLVEFLAADGRSRVQQRIPTFYSSNPRKLASVIANVTCFISADCGVMHLASASGTMTIGLFCVSDSNRYAPYGNGSIAIRTMDKTTADVARLAALSIESRFGAELPLTFETL